MEEYSARKNILKMIETLKSEFQIVDFIEENIPNDLLEEEEFLAQLKEISPKVEIALEILSGKEISKKIIEEIEDKGLESVIEDEEKLRRIPKKYKEELFLLAEKYEKEEEFEKAKNIYGKIVEFGAGQVGKFYQRNNEQDKARETIYYKSKFAYYKCKIQNGEKLTDEDMVELENLAKEDKYNILGLSQQGKLTSFEIFESLFEDISIDEIERDILPIITYHRGNSGGEINPPGPKKENEYDPELSPEKRLEHLKTDFEIESCKIGKGKFVGTFIFKIKNSDVVIVEKFYDVMGRKNNKVIVPSYGAATYYVHKDADIDLDESDRSNLVEMKKKEQRKDKEGISLKLIDSRRHSGKNYYEDQLKKFKKIEENGNIIREQREEQISEEIAEDNGKDIETDTPQSDIKELGEEKASDVEDEVVGDKKSENVPSDTSNSYTLEEMLTLIEEFDKEYAEFQSQLIDLDQKISELTIKIAELKQDIDEQMNGLLTKDNIITVIKEELSTIEECKAKKKELELLKEKIIAKEKENREERDKLKEEFQSRIKGEE